MRNNQTLKILFPIGSIYPAQSGGPSNTIYWLAKALKRKGIEVTIVTTDTDIPPEIKLNRWQFTNFGKVIYVKSLLGSLPLRHIFLSLRVLFKKNILHLTSLFYPPSFLLGTVAVIIGKPIIWSVRGELNPKALKYSSYKKRFILRLIKIFSKNITFHSTSNQETELTRQQFGESSRIIQLPNYMELPQKLSHYSNGNPYLLFLGRIHPIKALDNLVEALAVSKFFTQNNFLLKIAGDYQNTYGTHLQNLIKKLQQEKRIQFVGRVEAEEKETLLANAYVVVVPSHSENFGNVVVESLAQGTPVIASKGTPWSILEKYHAGFWVENEPKKLAKCIDKILQLDHQTYANYRKSAYQLVKSEFDIFQKVDQWIEQYEKIANG